MVCNISYFQSTGHRWYQDTAHIDVAGGARARGSGAPGVRSQGFPCRPSIPTEEGLLNVSSGSVGLLSTGGLGVTTPDALAGKLRCCTVRDITVYCICRVRSPVKTLDRDR